MKNLGQTIQKSETLVQNLDALIAGMEVSSDVRTRLSAGCLKVAMEHQKAIILLVAKSIHASAVALLRPTFEAYVRGVWLHKCAEDVDIDNFLKDDFDKKYYQLLEDIEKLPSHEDCVLSNAKNSNWGLLNSCTHCGIHQAGRQNTETTIEANYSEDELIEIVNAANAIGLLAGIAICDLAGDVEHATTILDMINMV